MKIAIIIVIIIIGIIVNSGGTGSPKAHAAGALTSLVAQGAQDVYLTGNATIKLKFDVSKLQSHMSKLRSEANANSGSQAGGMTGLVAIPAQDVYQIQSDVNMLQSEENKLISDITLLTI